MVAFATLKVGDVVWDCHRTKMGNTNISKMGSWEVKIVSINTEEESVMASWNHNPPERFGRHAIKKWRRTPAKQRKAP